MGWCKIWNGQSGFYQPGDTVSDYSVSTLYAQWRKSAHIYTFEKTQPGWSPEWPDYLVKPYNGSVQIPLNPVVEGYSLSYFLGRDANGNTYRLMPGDNVNINEDLIIQASIVEKSYYVKYFANNGTGSAEIYAHSKKHFSNLTIGSPTVPTNSTYSFLGWATSPTATTPNYQQGSLYTVNAPMELYALWGYKITYNANSGSGSMPIQNIFGASGQLNTNTFTKQNNTFGGWTTSSTGYIKYKNGATVTPTGNLSLYAVWKPNTLPSGAMQWNNGHIHYKSGSTDLYRNFGDVNLDGVVNATDATLVSQYAFNTTKPDIDLYNADINRDGVIDSIDSTLITRFVNGIITSYQIN